MAVDEALAESASKKGTTTLRAYSFDPPCVSVGRFQRLEGFIDLDACRTAGVDVVRRPTGGLAILHACDFTYSFTTPFVGDPTGARDRLFGLVASGIVASLALLGIDADVVSHKDGAAPPGWCFGMEYGVDIEWMGRKICGSAQRVARGSLLQHGSLFLTDDGGLADRICCGFSASVGAQRPVTVSEAARRDISWEDMAAAFHEGFSTAHGIELVPGRMEPPETESAAAILKEKYATGASMAGDSAGNVCDIIIQNTAAGEVDGG